MNYDILLGVGIGLGLVVMWNVIWWAVWLRMIRGKDKK